MDAPSIRIDAGGDTKSLLKQASQIGALTGAAGFVAGGTAGIVRNATPGVFATATAIQWSLLSTSYTCFRGLIARAWGMGCDSKTSERRSASALAGGLTGASNGLLTRGSRNVIPGAIMFSLFGLAGQVLYDSLDSSRTSPQVHESGMISRIAGSKWSPVSVLSDDDYAAKLREKLLKVDVEIGMVDDRIAALQQKADAQSAAVSTSSAKKENR